MKVRVISGIQPSKSFTIGNYLGAIRQWVPMQDTRECFFFLANLHVLTASQDAEALRHATRLAAATYIACGIDPKKSPIFIQSCILEHTELAWILSCLTPLGWLYRMTQFKDNSGKHKDQAGLGLLSYPVLMAADVLLYRATHVPVGDDQKQHLELIRDLAGLFNRTYAADFFPLPEPEILGAATRVMSLRDGTKKMSKSDPSDFSRINLTDTDEDIALKIRKAKTDPEPLPLDVGGFLNRPEARNLASIYSAFNDQSLEQTLQEFGGATFTRFKEALTGCLVASLNPISTEIQRLMKDIPALDAVLYQGQLRAQTIAQETMVVVREKVGLLPLR